VILADGEHPITARTETIRVKTADGLASEDHTIEEVPGYGLLLPEEVLPLPRSFLVDGDAILVRWTGSRATAEFRAYLSMARAKDLDELNRAEDLLQVGAVNWIAADADHIDYHTHADVPDRGAPAAHPMPWRILKGTDAQSLWTGAMLAADKMPHVRDPARGILASANNDPFGFTADGDV